MKRLAACAAVAALSACGPVVGRVEVTPPAATLDAAGARLQLQATVRAPDGKALPLAVRWTTYHPEVARVDEHGQVVAVRSGEALVTASVPGAAASARITVSIPAQAALEPAALELVGLPSTGALRLRLTDQAGRAATARSVTWRSSDQAVLQVTDGALRAVGPGQAVVTAEAAGLTASAPVTVRFPPFARIEVRPARLALRVGQSARLEAAAVDAAGAPVKGVPLGFASSVEAVARVSSDGTVSALSRGKARVVAAGGGSRAAVEVTVRK